MTQSKARKVRPKLVPISSSSASAGKGNDNDTPFDDSFSQSFDDGGLGFDDILTAAAATTATDAPGIGADLTALRMEVVHNDYMDDKHISDIIVNNSHVMDHEENGVTVSGIGGAAGMAEKLQDGTTLSSSGDDELPTDSDDDDESVSSSESESEPSDVDNHQRCQQHPADNTSRNSVEQMQRLQREIHSRQKLLSKILRGKEGTAYAAMIQSQETLVNSQLMDNLRMKGGKTTPSSSSSSSSAAVESTKSSDRRNSIQFILLDELHHTLPGAMSLVVHCVLYITTYSLIVKFVNLLCDILIVRFTGWDIKTNDFDCTHYEHAFHAILLILSLLASRITGVVYDWNDNKRYQKRIAFQLRNKWILQYWDAKLLNFFQDDSTRMKYEYYHENLSCWDERNGDVASQGSNTTTTTTAAAPITSTSRHRHHQRKIGWRLKYMIDLFSFFFCYKSVEYFLYYGCIIPLSEITDSVWANLPSRKQQQLQQQERVQWSRHGRSDIANLFDCEFDDLPHRKVQPGTLHHRYHSNSETTAGVSYACQNVRSALDNPFALDMLTWIAGIDTESDIVANWIANANNCGWSGVAARAREYDSPVDMEVSYSTKDQTIITTDVFVEDGDMATSNDVEHHQTCIMPRRIREDARINDTRDHDMSYYPETRKINAQDDEYIQNIISREAYYEFIRNPNPRFFDSMTEQLFWFVTTLICLGLLYICDIPFLLI